MAILASGTPGNLVEQEDDVWADKFLQSAPFLLTAHAGILDDGFVTLQMIRKEIAKWTGKDAVAPAGRRRGKGVR